MFVALAFLLLVSSGCLFGKPFAQDSSSAWVQPGAYGALEDGSTRGGYEVRFKPADPGFSMHPSAYGVERSLVAAHWPVGVHGERDRDDIAFGIEYLADDRARVSRYIGITDQIDASRVLFKEFLHNVTDASDTQIDSWFGEYVKGNRFNVEVRGPFTLGDVYDGFGAGAGEGGMEQWDTWEFVFTIESKSATRKDGDVTHRFNFGVSGWCNYVRTGPSNLSDAELRPLVVEEFRRLDLGEPDVGQLTFEHIHGD